MTSGACLHPAGGTPPSVRGSARSRTPGRTQVQAKRERLLHVHANADSGDGEPARATPLFSSFTSPANQLPGNGTGA